MNMKWFVRIVVLVALLLLGALGWQWLAADPGFVQLRIRGYVVETGRLVGEGKAQALLHDPAVRKAYLGAAAH